MINLSCLLQSPEVSSQFSVLRCSVLLPRGQLLPADSFPAALPGRVYLPTCCPGAGSLPCSRAHSGTAGNAQALAIAVRESSSCWVRRCRRSLGVAQRLSQPCPSVTCCPRAHSTFCATAPVPLAAWHCPLSYPLPLASCFPAWLWGDTGRWLFPIVHPGGNNPVPSPSWDQLDPTRKRLPKPLCSPRDGAAPLAVYSPLICLFPEPAGHNWALWGPRCPVSSPGPTRCRSGGLLGPSGRAEPRQRLHGHQWHLAEQPLPRSTTAPLLVPLCFQLVSVRLGTFIHLHSRRQRCCGAMESRQALRQG